MPAPTHRTLPRAAAASPARCAKPGSRGAPALVTMLATGLAATLLAGCTTRPLAAPGCRRDSAASNGSPDPPLHCLFFPSGVTVDPFGDLLYVTNPNSDLSFSNGTLVAVDLPRHEAAVDCFRRYGYGAAPAGSACGVNSCDSLRGQVSSTTTFPEIVALDDGIRARGEDPAAYDRCYCERDALDQNIVNCESHRSILRDKTVRTGNFSGEIALLAEDPTDLASVFNQNGNATVRRSLYLPVRGDPSLTVVDVVRRVARQPRPAQNPPGLDMRCTTDKSGPSTAECDRDHRVQRTPLGDEIYIDANDLSQGTAARFTLPQEPFGATIDRGCKAAGQLFFRYRDDLNRTGQVVGSGSPTAVPGPACQDPKTGAWNRDVYRTLVINHLASGDISAFNLNGPPAQPLPIPFTDNRPEGPGVPVLTDLRSLNFPADGAGRQGAFAVAPRVPGDPTQPWYATSRLSGQVNSFRLTQDLAPSLPPPGYSTVDPADTGAGARLYTPVQGPTIIPGLVFSISGSLPSDSTATRQDVRDLRFEPGGERLFLVLNRPPVIAVIDTSLDQESSPPGVPRNRLLRVINIGPGPSRAALSRAPLLSEGGQRPRRNLMYVAQFLSGELTAVDVDTGALVSTTFIGRGPVSVALNYGGEADGGIIDRCADPYVDPASPDLKCPAAAALQQKQPRAYVAAYLDNAVSVVDLNPQNPTYHRVVSRIGVPAPKTQ